MSIENLSSSNGMLRSIKAYEQAQKGSLIDGVGKSSKSEGTTKAQNGFANMLTDAMKEVNSLQNEADNKIEGMILGKGVQTHEAMIALEKADVAFQLMNNIRMKITRAYEEVMRTQV
jgi:flagellar hook-basal body complex protein FliE